MLTAPVPHFWTFAATVPSSGLRARMIGSHAGLRAVPQPSWSPLRLCDLGNPASVYPPQAVPYLPPRVLYGTGQAVEGASPAERQQVRPRLGDAEGFDGPGFVELLISRHSRRRPLGLFGNSILGHGHRQVANQRTPASPHFLRRRNVSRAIVMADMMTATRFGVVMPDALSRVGPLAMILSPCRGKRSTPSP